MRYLVLFVLIVQSLSCTDQSQKQTVATNVNSTEQVKNKSYILTLEEEFLPYLKFAGSVEVEIFKIIDPSFKKTSKIPSQLFILSQLMDLKLNKKTLVKATDIFLNCSQIKVEKINEKKIAIRSTCEKNPIEIAQITQSSLQHYEINFIQSAWVNVIGSSALLNQKDKICKINLSDKKVHEFTCEDTLLTKGVGAQLEEIKLNKITFHRTGATQIEVVGGKYKDFIERSKINITVPESGKINFKEEEILVKDDFEAISHEAVQGEIQSGTELPAATPSDKNYDNPKDLSGTNDPNPPPEGELQQGR